MINLLFCILRNADYREEEGLIDHKVNIPLYEYQLSFSKNNAKGKKAFVYQNDRIIVQDFGVLDTDKIFITDACSERKEYSYCLCTAFATMNSFAEQNPSDSNYLIILMEQPIKNADTEMFKGFLMPKKINHHVILICPKNRLDPNLKNFLTDRNNYSEGNFICSIKTFDELYKDRSEYELC